MSCWEAEAAAYQISQTYQDGALRVVSSPDMLSAFSASLTFTGGEAADLARPAVEALVEGALVARIEDHPVAPIGLHRRL